MITVVLSALGVAATLAVYLEPSLATVPDRNLFHSWTVDFDALGYPEAELRDRFRIGMVWSLLATIIYMVVVLGSNLIVAISRLDGGGSTSPEAAAMGETASGRQRPSVLRRLDIHNWAGRLASRHLLRPVRTRVNAPVAHRVAGEPGLGLDRNIQRLGYEQRRVETRPALGREGDCQHEKSDCYCQQDEGSYRDLADGEFQASAFGIGCRRTRCWG